MSTKNLKNITIAKFQSFLDLVQCNYISINGGHEKWTRADLLRPVIFQTHEKPIPEHIVKNNLRVLGYSKNDFFDIMEDKVKVVRNGNKYTLVPVVKNNTPKK